MRVYEDFIHAIDVFSWPWRLHLGMARVIPLLLVYHIVTVMIFAESTQVREFLD